jgi:release factor glutamine methyltransferase
VTVREALAEGAASLERAECPSPDVDVEWLLAHVLGVRRSELLIRGPDLSPDELDRFRAHVARRASREPLAYILGEWGFRRLTLVVDPRVLIPRPETESAVERCLDLLRDVEAPTVLEIGVGSGAIALAIADERRDAQVVATDVSSAALEVAEENRRRASLNGRVRFVHGDLLAGEKGPFHLVVSNPPYVASAELDALEPELRIEPREALIGEGGHEAVARAALETLVPGGALVLEVGDGQARDVAARLRELGFREVLVSEDLAGRERVVEGRGP